MDYKNNMDEPILIIPYIVLGIVSYVMYLRYMYVQHFHTVFETGDDSVLYLICLLLLVIVGGLASMAIGFHLMIYALLVIKAILLSNKTKEDIEFTVHVTLEACYTGIGCVIYHKTLMEITDGYAFNHVMFFILAVTFGLVGLTTLHKVLVGYITTILYQGPSVEEPVATTTTEFPLDPSELLSKLGYTKTELKQTINYVIDNKHYIHDIETLHKVSNTLTELPKLITRYEQLCEEDSNDFFEEYNHTIKDVEKMFEEVEASINQQKREAFKKEVLLQKKRMSS